MGYFKKYIIEISESHYIYFYEQSNEAYFGIEQKTSDVTNWERIPKNQYAIYGDYLYVNFDGCMYKADIIKLQIKPILWDVYNVYYLDECITAQVKKSSRRDEFIKIIPGTGEIEKLGNLVTPNIAR